ncbi:MAG: hypothetical protein KGQ94_05505 [Alphaproteobacteria bacterium]|nr:hypothetical protein [Alphaproteobacteria bacterium]
MVYISKYRRGRLSCMEAAELLDHELHLVHPGAPTECTPASASAPSAFDVVRASAGISTLCSVAKDQVYLGLQTVSGGASPSSSGPIMIAGNGDHDPLESMITMLWNE